jgi:prepilin-type N-terminal cleavage/methylation domain-containing protein
MKHDRHAAFTLLEIMLAITILAMVATAVYATWSAGLAGWKRSATITENLQRERVVMEMLTELTQSAVFFVSKDSLYEVQGTREAQTGDSISFVTASDLLLPQTEAMAGAMRRVTISMGRDTRGRPFLGIANAPALQPEKSPETVTHILSADVCGFAVRYRDPRSVSWSEEWGDAGLIPSAVEYTVAFGSNDGRTPPVVVTRTVELSTARYAMQLAGQGNASQQDTTNTVSRRDIDLSTPTGTSGGDIPGAE